MTQNNTCNGNGAANGVSKSLRRQLKISTPNVTYTDSEITSNYEYHTTNIVKCDDDELIVEPQVRSYTFKTQRTVPKVGMMMVGWGGNNGTTLTAALIANRKNITWTTKRGVQEPNFYGSITQASTVRVGAIKNKEIFVPLKQLVPMVDPCDIVVGGWDINSANLEEAMNRAQVLDYDLQQKIGPEMRKLKPLKSIYRPDFIAANQDDRADNVLKGMTLREQVDQIRRDIKEFKEKNGLDKVYILWTANTERFCEVRPGMNDTAENLLASIDREEPEISPSTLFCVASILEGCAYINGSPQNTFVPGVIELAKQHKVFIGGDDFKSGQTKLKSVLVDFLVQAGIKPTSIVSYNHLGNNDGKNLSAPAQFRSKEVSKSNVVDDMVHSNDILYKTPDDEPDHCVVIKYVPYVADSKRAMDEYTAEIFMGGSQTFVIHNTCEDSLLAAPLMIDLVVLTELFDRITVKLEDSEEFERFDTVLSVLSYMLKAPLVPAGTPLVNALFRQRSCVENILKALVGLPPDNHMLLEHKIGLKGNTEYH